MNCEPIGLRAEAILEKSVAGLKLKNLKDIELELTLFENQERDKFVQKMIAKGEYDPEAILKKREEKLKQKNVGQAVAKIKRKGKRNKPSREKSPWRDWED